LFQATQEEELQRVLAEKAAADRRAAECAAEAVQLREERDGLSVCDGRVAFQPGLHEISNELLDYLRFCVYFVY